MKELANVKQVSECFIKPNQWPEESKQLYHLGPWDLAMLSMNYIQNGLLFPKPNTYSTDKFMDALKDSLSATLVHFYPLAGRLATRVDEAKHQSLVFVDCVNSHGARFIHATLDASTSDILSPTDVPLVVQSFFDHHKAVNYDGHTQSLFSVQVTELVDGVFVGVSMNHVVGDGVAYWHFWNTWSQIHLADSCNNNKFSEETCLSSVWKTHHADKITLPVHKRWVPDGYSIPVFLPFTHPDEFISRHERPPLRERIFHFSPDSISNLKSKANQQANTTKISSFQALSALVWRSIVRSNQTPPNNITNCRLAINNRPRLSPPLPNSYFGNALNAVKATTTARELLSQTLGWAATALHQAIAGHTDKEVRDFVINWMKDNPCIYQAGKMFDPNSVMMGSSPRFDMYGNEFGLGRAMAVMSGYANKYVGKVSSYPGREGGGSVDLEICLEQEAMERLESDQEFIEAVCL